MHPQNEEYWGNVNPVGPRGVYDEAKRFMESITMAYHTFHNVDTRIVRIFNTYGPRMRLNDGRALPAFIGQALRGDGDPGDRLHEGRRVLNEIGFSNCGGDFNSILDAGRECDGGEHRLPHFRRIRTPVF